MSKSTKPKFATSFKETAFGILPRSEIVRLEAEGIKKAQQYIIKLSSPRTKITPQVILDIHKQGFGFIFPDWAGKFRTVDVTMGDYEPPHYSKVSELVKNICDDLAERFEILLFIVSHLSHLGSNETKRIESYWLLSLLWKNIIKKSDLSLVNLTTGSRAMRLISIRKLVMGNMNLSPARLSPVVPMIAVSTRMIQLPQSRGYLYHSFMKNKKLIRISDC